MKRCFFLPPAVLCSALAFAQGTTSPSSKPAPAPSSNGSSGATAAPAGQLKVRGPEAVAQAEPNRVVATIDGKQITARDAANMLKAIPTEQRKQYEANLPNVLQQIYMSKQIAGEAVKMNLDQQSPWKEQLELNRDQILTRAYLNDLAAKQPATGTSDPQQYYNSHPEEFDQAKLSGIFVSFNPPGTPATNATNNRTEEQARQKADDLEKKIKAGGDFSALARTDSDNQQAASRGGELGTYSLGDPNLPPDVKAALLKLQPGQTSEPIRIPNGFLIIKLESRSKLGFDQARASIVQKQQNERSQAVVKQELDKYKIQVQDPEFFNASAGGTGPGIPSLQRPASSPGAQSSTPAPQPSASPVKPQAQR